MKALAHSRPCQFCGQRIFVVICRDGRWRSFDPDRIPPGPCVWAWRKRLGMEETELVHGHRLHYCAEYDRVRPHAAADAR